MPIKFSDLNIHNLDIHNLERIKFRQMLLQDLDEVCQIEREIYGDHCWSRSSFVNDLNNENAALFVLEDRRTIEKRHSIIGYIVLWIIDGDGHIANFAIKKNLQEKKYGTLMMLFTMEKVIGWELQRLTLEVRESNIRAQALYEKFGFTVEGIRPKYYADNQENALIMWTPNIQ